MVICQWVPPAADENTIPWLLAKTKVYAVNLSLNWARGWEEGTS